MHEVDQILSHCVNKKKTPSVQYVIFDQAREIHRFQYGYADIQKQIPLTEETTYNLYSITKTFTALAVLQLAEQHRLNIDEPVINYLPRFPYTKDTTIRQLLSHTAGIPNPIPISWIHLASEHGTFNRDAFIAGVLAQYPDTKAYPNQRFAYSNLGYMILGQLIEAVSGMRYEQYICEHIVRSMNLPDYSLGFTISDSKSHATGYHKMRSLSYLLLGWMIDKKKFMKTPEDGWVPFQENYVNGAAYGGLIGTSGALTTYVRELLRCDSSLLSEAGKKLLFTEQHTDNGKNTGMCLSWFKGNIKGKTFYTHAGGGGGYYVEMRLYPDAGIGSLIFFNRTGFSDERFLDKIDSNFL